MLTCSQAGAAISIPNYSFKCRNFYFVVLEFCIIVQVYWDELCYQSMISFSSFVKRFSLIFTFKDATFTISTGEFNRIMATEFDL